MHKGYKVIIGILLTLVTTTVQAKTYGNLTVETLQNIYDGDTFRCTFKNLHPLIGENIRIRINAIDAPEIKSKTKTEQEKAIKARNRLRYLLKTAKKIECKNIKRGHYFRIIADVYIDGKSVASILIKEGLVTPYPKIKVKYQ